MKTRIMCAAVLALVGLGKEFAWGHPDDWPMYQYDVRRTGYVPHANHPINRTSVATLTPKWVRQLSDSVIATPVVIQFDDFDPVTDGAQPKKVVYVGSGDGNFYALDAADGSVVWTFTADPAPGIGYHMFVSSAFVDLPRNRLYVAGGFTMYALDLYQGTLIWKWSTAAHGGGEIETSPLMLNDAAGNGTVYFGSDRDGNMPGVATRFPAAFAVDAPSGALKWFWRPSWPDNVDQNGNPQISGDGDVWASVAADQAEGLLYLATSDAGRGAQPLYSESVIALPIALPRPCTEAADTSCLDAVTLERRSEPPNWYHQPRLVDPYDADFGSTPLLFDRDGKKYLGIGGKDGFYYVVERQVADVPDTFRHPLWKKRVVQGGFAGGFIGATATDGRRIWGATAMFDIPTEAQSTFLTPNPLLQPPFLHAFDAVSGSILWQQLGPGPTFGAATVVNGVLFAASLDSQVMAFDGETGQLLWAAPVLGPSSSGIAISGSEIFVGSGTKAQGLGLPALNGIQAFALAANLEETDGLPPSLPPSPWPLGVVKHPDPPIPDETEPNPGP